MNIKSFIGYVLYPDCACWLCRLDAPLGEDHLCDACREKLRACIAPAAPLPLDGLSAGLLYEDPVPGAMHAFKYGKQRYYAKFFARYMSLPAVWQFDCLVPVPLHPLKLWLRSFNQSEELCLALAAEQPAPIRKDLLRRTRFTGTQTRLDPKAREHNVRNAFAASPEAKGLGIVLVDDVCTTRTTLIACAAALKKAGAARVYAACACLARD